MEALRRDHCGWSEMANTAGEVHNDILALKGEWEWYLVDRCVSIGSCGLAFSGPLLKCGVPPESMLEMQIILNEDF